MTNTSFKLIFAALAATAALTACTKEPTPGKADADPKAPVTEGTRVIAVSFAPQTKTALDSDGLTPYFKKDDKILLCAEPEEPDTEPKVDTCKVQIDSNGNPFITTDLEGDLSAVYPVTAVKNVIDEESGEEVMRIFIPSVQSGRFADANIVTGQIKDDSNEVTFEPNTALLRFYVDKSIGVKSIKVTGTTMSINNEEGDSSRITTVTAPEGHTLDEVTDDPGGRLCYIAVPNDVNKNGVKFEIETTTQDKVEKTTKATGKFVKGEMYDVFIPYYVKVKVSDDPEIYQKWAYCNIGAFLPEEPGEYFAWGETKGYKYVTNKFEDDHIFNWKNCPFNDGAETYNSEFFSQSKSDVCPNGILDLKYDAANANWGDKWRMPTSQDFQDLLKGTNTDNSDVSSEGYVHLRIRNTNLIFPTSGNAFDYGLTNPSTDGEYWLSNLFNDSSAQTFAFDCYNWGPLFTQFERYVGHAIRPIYDPALEPKDGELPGVFMVGENKAVKFSKGLLYWDGDSFEFEENQLAYATTWDASHISHFYWSKSESVARASSYSDASASANDVLFTNATDTTANPNFTVNGETGKYRSLSNAEMKYLLEDRPDANTLRRARVSIDGVYYYVLAPSGFSNQIKYSYTSAEWAIDEKKGFICFPYGGTRNSMSISGSHGYVYTSTPKPDSKTQAYIFTCYDDGRMYTDITMLRNGGRMLRLVCDVE